MKSTSQDSSQHSDAHKHVSTATAVKGTKSTLIGQWVKFTIQFCGTVVLARVLKPEDFGEFAMIMALGGFATLMGDFGLSTAAMQAKTLSKGQQNNLFWLNVAIGSIIASGFFVLAPWISKFYNEPGLIMAIQILAFNFLFQSALAQMTARAARGLQFKLLARADVLAQFMALVVAIILALRGAGLYALVWQQLAVSITLIGILVAGTRWIPGLPARAPMGDLIRFGSSTFAVQLMTYLSSNADSVVVGKVWGASALGIYDKAFQLFRMPIQQIATPLTRVALPILSARQDDSTWLTSKLSLIQRYMVYVVGSIFIFVAIASKPIVEILLGENWAASAGILSILAVGGIFQCMGYTYYWTFLVTKSTAIQFRYTVLTRSFMLVAIVLGALHSPQGAALGFSFGLFCNWVILTLFAIPKTGVNVKPLVRATLLPLIVITIANAPSVILILSAGSFLNPVSLLAFLLLLSILGYILCILIPQFRTDLRSLLKILKVAVS